MRSTTTLLVVAAGCVYFSVPVFATQAVTIFSNDGDAQKCSAAAHTAAQTNFASHDALEACDRALEYGHMKKRDRAATYVNRGIIATALSRFQEAFRNYHQAMGIMPDMPEPYIGRGNIYFLAGKLDKSIADYSRALDLDLGREHVAFLNRGMAYEKLKQYDAAEEDYRMALEAVPDWELAQQKLSFVRARQTVNP
ncbi:MAG: tetratricopeptide repeat protein [Gammaproteobacteria bacterium]